MALNNTPRFRDSELTDGHTHGTFNLYFDKPVKYFWDVYTCIGCGARGQFLDLHSGYDGNGDSWDTLYKDIQFHDLSGQELQETKQKIINDLKSKGKCCTNSSHILDRDRINRERKRQKFTQYTR